MNVGSITDRVIIKTPYPKGFMKDIAPSVYGSKCIEVMRDFNNGACIISGTKSSLNKLMKRLEQGGLISKKVRDLFRKGKREFTNTLDDQTLFTPKKGPLEKCLDSVHQHISKGAERLSEEARRLKLRILCRLNP